MADCVYNLLDTPGHEDFSEDTYRTLTAVDFGDHGDRRGQGHRGAHAQAVRSLPAARHSDRDIHQQARPRDAATLSIFSTRSKRRSRSTSRPSPGRSAAAALSPAPMICERKIVRRLDRDAEPVAVTGPDDPFIDGAACRPPISRRRGSRSSWRAAALKRFDEQGLSRRPSDAGLLRQRAAQFRRARSHRRAGANSRRRRMGLQAASRKVDAREDKMTGFVFKIQANMDPNHRDRIAFMRVCSGKLRRGMKAKLVRTGKNIALNAPQFFFAQDRQLAEEAYAGRCRRHPQPWHIAHRRHADRRRGCSSFAACRASRPEILRRVKIGDAMKAKKLREALGQMAEEGVVQLFLPNDGSGAIVGVVGALQLDVLAERLAAEYGLEVAFETSRFETLPLGQRRRLPAELEKFIRAPIRPPWRSISTARRSFWPPPPGTCNTSRRNGRRSPSPTSRIIRRRRAPVGMPR